jgi:nicotinamide mononucleotide transporter
VDAGITVRRDLRRTLLESEARTMVAASRRRYSEPTMIAVKRDHWILIALLLATSAISVISHERGISDWLEVFAFVSGALCVWLTVKENVWNFPVSLLNVLAFGFVFFRTRLFGDAALQVVYFVLTIQGWYLWLYGGEQHSKLRISRCPRREAAAVAAAGLFVTAGLATFLRHVNGAIPLFDATTTALSLCAQYLLNRKYLENWHCWIAADIIYIPIYAYKGLWLTSLLYAIFLGMAIMGFVEWQGRYRELSRRDDPLAVPIMEADLA